MIPLLEFDDDRSAVIEPSRVIKNHPDMPERCVACFFQDAIRRLLDDGAIQEIAFLSGESGRNPVYAMKDEEVRMAVFHPGVGAPLAAGSLEEVIALGARKFIVCGGAGTLDSRHHVGALMIPTSAVRDEGTSYHYLPPDRDAVPSKRAVEAIVSELTEANIPYELTKTWTTDGFYRETRRKVQKRIAMGCSCVEMEAAAFFAVAEFRAVELAQLLYAGDDLGGESWDSRKWTSRKRIRDDLLRISINACARL